VRFKPSLWHPVTVVLSGINLAAAGFAAASGESTHAAVHVILAMAFGFWAQRLRQGPGAAVDDLSRMKAEMDRQAAALEETQAMLASQSTELAELQERLDFTERMLAQVRDRPPLGNREPHA